MVAKQETSLNKSVEIRKALTQYPDKGPTEIARLLTQRHKVAFRPKHVTSVKAKQRAKVAPAGKPSMSAVARQTAARRAPLGTTAPAGSVAAMVANLQAYIQRLGKKDLHGLIDTL